MLLKSISKEEKRERQEEKLWKQSRCNYRISSFFLMDCICIVLSYILASYLRFGNLWGGYTKGIVLLRMGILLMSITLVYFIFNPNRNFFSRTKKQELIAVFRNILIMGAAISMAAFLMQDAQKYSRLVYGYFLWDRFCCDVCKSFIV